MTEEANVRLFSVALLMKEERKDKTKCTQILGKEICGPFMGMNISQLLKGASKGYLYQYEYILEIYGGGKMKLTVKSL